MSFNKDILTLPIYYGAEFAYKMLTTGRDIFKYNRPLQREVYANKYMVMVTFNNKNERNPKLLPWASLSSWERSKISITVK